MGPTIPPNKSTASEPPVTCRSEAIIPVPSISPRGNICHFLDAPAEIRLMIYPLLLASGTIDTLDLHRTLRARRLQRIHTAILYVNKRINEEATHVLYRDTVICLSSWDLLCLDDAEDFEAIRQQLWRSLQQNTLNGVLPDNLSGRTIPELDLRHGIPRLPVMQGLIDSSIFKRFRKLHIDLSYIQFGWNVEERYPGQINLRLRDLEAEYDFFEVRGRGIVRFLRDVEMFEILVRVISQVPKVRELSLNLYFLIQELNPSQASSTTAQQDQDSVVLSSVRRFTHTTDWDSYLKRLSNVTNFNMELYPRDGQSAWESSGNLFEVPSEHIATLAHVKSVMRAKYLTIKRLNKLRERINNFILGDGDVAASRIDNWPPLLLASRGDERGSESSDDEPLSDDEPSNFDFSDYGPSHS